MSLTFKNDKFVAFTNKYKEADYIYYCVQYNLYFKNKRTLLSIGLCNTGLYNSVSNYSLYYGLNFIRTYNVHNQLDDKAVEKIKSQIPYLENQ